MLSTLSFANDVTQLECRVTSVRKSLAQLTYDYTLGIESHMRKLPIDIDWISKGDTISLSFNNERAQNNRLIINYSTLENDCNNNKIEKNHTKTLAHDQKGKIDLSRNNEFVSFYMSDPSNLDLYVRQDSIYGKMRLRTSGSFNSKSCEQTTDDVIISFNCKSE